MTDLKRECSTCAHWKKTISVDFGHCRRHAPKPANYTSTTPANKPYVVWPLVHCTLICGEYKIDAAVEQDRYFASVRERSEADRQRAVPVDYAPGPRQAVAERPDPWPTSPASRNWWRFWT